MEAALSKIGEQGVVGAMLVLLLLTIAYLQRRRDSDAEARLKEARETLITAAETNRILAALKDAVTGLSQSIASLTATTQTMHADVRSAFDKQSSRDERVERMIEASGEAIREIEATARENNRLIERANAALDRAPNGGR